MHVAFQDQLLGFLAQQPLFDGFAGFDVHVLAVLFRHGHHGGGNQHHAVFGVDAGQVGDRSAGVVRFLEDLEHGLFQDHDGGALAGLQLGQRGGAGFDHHFIGGQAVQEFLAVVVVLNQGGDGGVGGAAGQRVAHGDQALQAGIGGEVLEGLGDGDALGGPFVDHFRVVGQHHVAHADGVPVALFVIGEAEQLARVLDFDGLEVAGFLELQGEGGLGHQHHVAAQGAGFHLAVDLGDQRGGAAVEEEAAVVAGHQVREFLFQRFVHHVDDELVHGGVDGQFALHVLVDGERGRHGGQDQHGAEQQSHYLFHTNTSFLYFFIPDSPPV